MGCRCARMQGWAMLKKFATKLMVAALLVAAVPVLILGVYAYSRISRSLQEGAVEAASARVLRADLQGVDPGQKLSFHISVKSIPVF